MASPASPLPATKAARQARITEILRTVPVHSQTALAACLAAEGLSVTQATLSRDLDEIGAAKVPSADGGQVYAVPTDGSVRVLRAPGSTDPSARLVHMLEELLVEADGAHNLALLKTLPGGAPLLASAIDHAQLPGVLGTVAGDDTVLLACREERGGPVVAERLRLLAAGRRTTDRTDPTVEPVAVAAGPAEPSAEPDPTQETTQ